MARIAIVHSFYSSSSPSGENVAVRAQVKALSSAGHEVMLLSRETDRESKRRNYPIRAAFQVATGRGPDPTDRLRQFEPDVVHVHNLFPNIGTRWLAHWEGPVVATLHNFRPLCANALLFRDGTTCTACPAGDRLAGVRHGCYHDSPIATLPIALRNLHGPVHDAVLHRADAIIVLSRTARDIYAHYSVDPARIRVVPNFVSALHSGHVVAPVEPQWVVVSRLSGEKGVGPLLRALPPNTKVDIIGSGSLSQELANRAPTGVRFVGSLPNPETRQKLSGYTGMIFPSLATEGLPTVILESLEAGIPFVTASQNSAAKLAVQTRAGAVYDSDNTEQLQAGLDWIVNGGEELRALARQSFVETFSEMAWTQAITEVYESLVRS